MAACLRTIETDLHPPQVTFFIIIFIEKVIGRNFESRIQNWVKLAQIVPT